MLTVDTLVDYFLAMSGQFVIPDFLATTNMTDSTLNMIVKIALKSYSELIPVTKTERMLLHNGMIFTDVKPTFIISIGHEFNGSSVFSNFGNRGTISTHRWTFSNNQLILEYPKGFYIVTYATHHELKVNTDDNKLSCIETIKDSDTLFMDLFTAHMMIAVGRSRRTFALADLPFAVDFSEMISEGTELRDNTLTALRERTQQYLVG